MPKINSILIIGNGGREYAISKKLAETHKNSISYCATYETNLSNYAGFIQINSTSTVQDIAQIACNFDCVFVGPEKYLEMGISDHANSPTVRCIGPTSRLAKIETSKVWARSFIHRIGLQEHNPDWFLVLDKPTSEKELLDYVTNQLPVIKPDNLHGGIGVKIINKDITPIQSVKYIQDILKTGERIILEKKLEGHEFSLMSWTDGKSLAHMPPVQDFKRAFDNNQGHNTGSMGSVTGPNEMLDFLTQQDLKICHDINTKIIQNLSQYGLYRGILYGSYMKINTGAIKIIEFNCRLGDPETINIMHLLETPLVNIFEAILNQTLDQITISYTKDASVFKYVVPIGYATSQVQSNKLISIPTNISQDNLIFGNLQKNQDKYITTSSRSFGIIYSSSSIKQASDQINKYLKNLPDNLYFRYDIGQEPNIKSNYELAGVNIQEGNKVISQIKSLVEATFNSCVVSEFGDFSGLYALGDNILVASTDGVGTKSLLVLDTYGPEIGYNMLGHDIVNHCVNDTLVKGARPLFFLDYFASGKLEASHTVAFVRGISQACQQVKCVLLGGETAEMPDIYQNNASDVVGTMIGLVSKSKVINGKEKIKSGDLIIGLASSGPHTNGYSLIRNILNKLDSSEYFDLLPKLCATHKCYLEDINTLETCGIDIHGLCHVTGGGFQDNPPRILPKNLEINWETWEFPEVFKFLQSRGNISYAEMLKVFNCGIGMLVFINPNDLSKIKLEYTQVGQVINKYSPV